MRSMILTLSALFSVSAFANAGAKFQCVGVNDNGILTIGATLNSLTELSNISFVNAHDAHISGSLTTSLPVDPTTENRFYFHSGNTSDYLMINDMEGFKRVFNATHDEILKSYFNGDHKYEFRAKEVFEQYERGGSQDVTPLICSVLVEQ